MAEVKRLYRSRANRILAGVCGGIGEYMNVDPTIIRVIVILVALVYGTGILLYIIAWLIIPERPIESAQPIPPPPSQTV
jgi:phage shock protein C